VDVVEKRLYQEGEKSVKEGLDGLLAVGPEGVDDGDYVGTFKWSHCLKDHCQLPHYHLRVE
jgi:hypothetical protein